MPYINSKDGRREKLRDGELALNAGELNFQIFYNVKHADDGEISRNKAKKLNEKIKLFVKQFLGNKPNYQKYNDMSGVMIRCYKELERRLGIKYIVLFDILLSYDKEIEDYENVKIKENQDVE